MSNSIFENEKKESEKELTVLKAWVCGVGLILGFVSSIILLIYVILPNLNVYKRTLDGHAALEEAKYSRQILIEEAKAKKEAAEFLNQAEVLRAVGLAKAIGKIQEKKVDYLQYLLISSLGEMNKNGNLNTIYIPHALDIPLQESTRLLKPTLDSIKKQIEKANEAIGEDRENK